MLTTIFKIKKNLVVKMKPHRQNSAQQQQVQPERPGSVKNSHSESARVGSSSGGGGNRYPIISPNQPINDTMLNRFIEIATKTEDYERQGIFEGLKIAEEEFEALEKSKRQAEINHKVLTEQTKKEKQDFDNISQPTVQSFFKDKQAHSNAITKEQEEYMQALNRLEIAQNELKAISDQYEHSKEKLSKYKKENQKALDLYNEQMNILYTTFDGDFGSELENQLEKEVKALTESKDTLRSALHKWSNARFLLVYAYNQIQYAESKWSELMRKDFNDPERAIYATEVRNNLVAANQNLQNTRTYLKNIELPYCTEDDLKTLQGLAQGTYQDMQSVQRQRYVVEIVQALRKRCAALNQWFDSIIKDSLVVDYSRVKIDFDQKSKQLKMERIRLLQEKIKEKTGKDIKINLSDHMGSKKDNLNLSTIMNTPFGPNENPTGAQEITEKPLSNFDLPPPPSKEQILGNIEQIKKQYWQQVDEWNKHMDSSKREADDRLNKMLAQYKKSDDKRPSSYDKKHSIDHSK